MTQIASNTPGMQARPEAQPTRKGRLLVDAPSRAFHWLFALSFAGAWLTAESEQWRLVHVTLGYAFGGLLLFRLAYGLIGPRSVRLSMLLRKVSGVPDWFRAAFGGRLDLSRSMTLAMGGAILLLLLIAAPLVLTGYASYVEWLGLEDMFEEFHEFFADVALALVLAHLALIVVLSIKRRRNVAKPMLTGRLDGQGPDVVKANRGPLAVAVILAFVGFIAWQLTQEPTGWTGPAQMTDASSRHGFDHHRRHHDDD